MGLLRMLVWIWRSRLLRWALRLLLRLVRYIGWRRVARVVLQLRRRGRQLGRFRLNHARGR